MPLRRIFTTCSVIVLFSAYHVAIAAPVNDGSGANSADKSASPPKQEAQQRPLVGEMVPFAFFSIGKYEVTLGQWQAVMGITNDGTIKTCGLDCPATQLSRERIQIYLTKLNKMTGKHYRLPKVREWEQACGMGSKYCGSNNLGDVAWYDGNSGMTIHPVGQKQPNANGLYDMSGNALEWMDDCDGSSCAMQGGSFGFALRGGSFGFGPLALRSLAAHKESPNTLAGGFRLAIEGESVDALATTELPQQIGREQLVIDLAAEERAIQASRERVLSIPPLAPEMVSVGSFSIGKYEVTLGQWLAVMGSVNAPVNYKHCGQDCPVAFITWDEIQIFLSKLNQMTGKHYRLPTVKEWEHACGTGMQYCGSNDLDSVAWYISNSNRSMHPVGLKQPNAYGLYDMSGNVWEWTDDCSNGSKKLKNCRSYFAIGGSWEDFPKQLHTTPQDGGGPGNRGGAPLDTRRNTYGFRLALLMLSAPCHVAREGIRVQHNA